MGRNLSVRHLGIMGCDLFTLTVVARQHGLLSLLTLPFFAK